MNEQKVRELIAKWRESAESCDQTGMEQDVLCGTCLLNCADELEAALAGQAGAAPSVKGEDAWLDEIEQAWLETTQIKRRNVYRTILRAFAANLKRQLEAAPAAAPELSAEKVQTWANNCSAYEEQHTRESTHYGSASHLAQEYHRGAKEAYQRVADALRGAGGK